MKLDTRADFEDYKVEIMNWCLKLKLANHPIRFGRALQKTGAHAIVEESKKDSFWGAKPISWGKYPRSATYGVTGRLHSMHQRRQ